MRKIFFVITFVALLVSCKNLLNIIPVDQISTETMWTTEELADKGMNGLYENFRPETGSNTAGGARMSTSFIGINRITWAHLEFQTSGHANLTHLSDATKRADRSAIQHEWKWGYTGIHQVNDAIENLSKAPLSTEKYERYLCEARFLRAYYYSRLNMIYQGVPIYLEVVSNEECTRTQSTAKEVWEVVLDDLNYCIENQYMPSNTLTTDYGRPSKGAAYSLRGRAYMWLAWENEEDNTYYQLAANDFEKVSECGYGLWNGNYIDFFCEENEKDKEMIFPLQFTDDPTTSDYVSTYFGGRDTYNSWSEFRPTADFVNYFQNADGSKFEWTSRIPEWDDDVFINDFTKREVFFLRDSISLDSSGKVVRDYWTETQSGTIQERIDRIGRDVFNKYYLKDGNEDRLRTVYNDRDPRLKDIVLVLYDPWTTYFAEYNNDKECYNKELRWPFLLDAHADGKDFYIGQGSNDIQYVYKKYCYHLKGQLPAIRVVPTDWPIIRYTEIYLALAECYIHLGRLSDAVSIINAIRSRAKMPNVAVGSYDEVMEAMRYERRIELCAEGYDWFDEWRWGTFKDMKFQGHDVYGETTYWGEWDGFIHTWYYTDDMFPWGCPASEYQKNPNLVPREGWIY